MSEYIIDTTCYLLWCHRNFKTGVERFMFSHLFVCLKTSALNMIDLHETHLDDLSKFIST